jgi:hypothetical protein
MLEKARPGRLIDGAVAAVLAFAATWQVSESDEFLVAFA